MPVPNSFCKFQRSCKYGSLAGIVQQGRVKRKSAFEIQIILCMRKVSSGPYSPFIHSVVSMVLLADSEGPDQTARMRRLISAFDVRICPKARFRMPRPSYRV